jgi:cyclopropane-fatty-acyl-phospholipid synthase
MPFFKRRVKEILKGIDVEINGSRPWDIQVHDERLYSRVLLRGSIGLGESYMDGWWDVEKLDEFFYRLLKAGIHYKQKAPGQDLFHFISNSIFNRQTLHKGSLEVIEKHYNIGNDLYEAFLDKYLMYTCGYWSGNPPARTLDEAQEAKMDLICRKLNLKPGQAVLDIGCGWGGFAKFAATKYGAHVTGISLSDEQIRYAKEFTKGLSVEILKKDYREMEGQFDAIVTIGMIEHVGPKNYRHYMEVVHRCLKDGGLSVLHTIGGNFGEQRIDPWFDKYIFPNGAIPHITDIGRSIRELFVMEDWHNFGADYDKTLMAWWQKFDGAWPQLEQKYGKRFYRMWKYYLLSIAGGFRSRDTQLWQIVLSKHGVAGGYRSVR